MSSVAVRDGFTMNQLTTKEKIRIQPEYELVEQQGGESIRYLEHGFPSPLVRWHYHDEYELHLIKESSGKVFIGDYIGNFQPDSIILVGPNLPHNWISQIDKGQQVPLRDCVINFSQEMITASEQTYPELKSLQPFWERARCGLEFSNTNDSTKMLTLFEEISQSTGFRRLTRFWTLIELLASSQEYRTLSTSTYLPHMDEKILNRLHKAVNYIFDHYDTQISLDEVATHIEMSPTAFSRFFKKSTGHKFIEFVNSLRVSKACEQLVHSEEPITEICFSVGFNNIANFNRRFYDLKKMTPSEYRKTSLEVLYRV